MATGTIRDLLRSATRSLIGRVESPAVDAEVLVRAVLGRGPGLPGPASRAELFARADQPALPELVRGVQELVERRGAGEPLQYLTGHQPFRHLDLLVGPGVLVPRPETELVVEHALGRIAGLGAPVVVDVGTGSGAIALSIAAERPDAQVWATEVSPEAAQWAARNRSACQLEEVRILVGDLLGPLPGSLRGGVDLVVANPPYLAAGQLGQTAPDVRDHEPLVALVSGPTGEEVPARVIDEAWDWLRPGGWLVMETWPGQAEALVGRLSARYRQAGSHPDLTGSLRVVEGRRPPAAPADPDGPVGLDSGP